MTIAIETDRRYSIPNDFMKKQLKIYSLPLLCGLIVLLASTPCLGSQVREVSYLYKLSTFTGPASVGGWPKLRLDGANNELYVLSENEIRIFNQNGMEIYHLNSLIEEEAGTQTISDAAVKKNGDIVFLAQSYRQGKSRYSIVAANYRGAPVSRIVLKNLPAHLSDFHPDRMLYRDDRLYLASLSGALVVITDEDGSYQSHYDIMSLLRKEEEKETAKRSRKGSGKQSDYDREIGDFSLDADGNILFTIPVAGEAYRLTPDLQLSRIGSRGSGPGKFGIPSGIAADTRGNYLVSDVLRCVVMVFDKDLKFVGTFGGRRAGQYSLIAPRGLAVDANNRLYVSQSESMGVSVFQLIYN
jgi:hypothetical protein